MSRPPALLHDLPVELVVELGRTQLTVAELAELQRDQLVELDKLANQELDVMVGGRLLARGEIVLDGDEVALRITEMVHLQRAETA
jgi:flagellar motor switch protein FliN/FliY